MSGRAAPAIAWLDRIPAASLGSSSLPLLLCTTACHIAGPLRTTMARAPGSVPVTRSDAAWCGARSSQSPQPRSVTMPAWSKCSAPGGSGFHLTPFRRDWANVGASPFLIIASLSVVTASSAAFSTGSFTWASGIATLTRMVKTSVDDLAEEVSVDEDHIGACEHAADELRLQTHEHTRVSRGEGEAGSERSDGAE